MGLDCVKKRSAEQIAEKSIPLEAHSGTVRSIVNCGAAASEKQILRPLRDFSFHIARVKPGLPSWPHLAAISGAM
jgi:hypothetical protein